MAGRHRFGLLGVRLAWASLAGLTVGLFAVGVPAEFAQLQTPCLTPVCTTGQLPPDGLRALTDLGLGPSGYAVSTVAMDIVLALGYVSVSALILWRGAGDRVAVLASLALLTFGTATFGFTLAALAVRHPAWAIPVSLLHLLGAISFGLFLYLFPDGRFVPRWTRWSAAAWLTWQLAEHLNPTWTTHPDPWQVAVESAVWLAAAATVIYAQIHRYTHVADAVQRQQIKWVVFGISIAFGGFLAIDLALSAFASAPEPTSPTAVLAYLVGYTFVSYLLMLAVPGTIGIAMLRHHLFDIDLVVNRTAVYAALTASVVGVYVLVVGSLGALLPMEQDFVVSLLTAGLVAALFAPLRERLQRGVNHLMYGDRDDPHAVLTRLGTRLGSTLTPDAVLPAVARTVREALKLPWVAIELRQEGGFVTVASAGEPVAGSLRLPLVYAGDTVGRLALGPRAGEGSFPPRERRLLRDLAQHVGVAAHAVRLTHEAMRLSADLQRSRERLVTAREEERRRLRRDLHDGLGPQLAALTMTAEAARDAVADNPARADLLLAGVIEQAQDAVADVRRVVYELRPPALDAVGLSEALRLQAAQLSGLRVRVALPEQLPALPAAVEVALYRIAAEALSNVARHSGAASCLLELAVDTRAGTVRLEVADDGRGFGAGRGTGVGLSSMRERAAELGGTLTVAVRSPSGTRVTALLPYAASAGSELER